MSPLREDRRRYLLFAALAVACLTGLIVLATARQSQHSVRNILIEGGIVLVLQIVSWVTWKKRQP